MISPKQTASYPLNDVSICIIIRGRDCIRNLLFNSFKFWIHRISFCLQRIFADNSDGVVKSESAFIMKIRIVFWLEELPCTFPNIDYVPCLISVR